MRRLTREWPAAAKNLSEKGCKKCSSSSSSLGVSVTWLRRYSSSSSCFHSPPSLPDFFPNRLSALFMHQLLSYFKSSYFLPSAAAGSLLLYLLQILPMAPLELLFSMRNAVSRIHLISVAAAVKTGWGQSHCLDGETPKRPGEEEDKTNHRRRRRHSGPTFCLSSLWREKIINREESNEWSWQIDHPVLLLLLGLSLAAL